MQSSKTRVRKDFAPLTMAVSIRCTTPASPTTQVLNGENGEYEPDRELTPTIILPEVVANASDGSWSQPYSNSQLANMKWYVNDVDISTLSDWVDKYSIGSVGTTRGAITIKRNVSAGEQIALRFTADLVDSRLGVTLPVKTDAIMLTTSQKATDNYSLSLTDGNNLQYDITADKLALYKYKVAHSLLVASADAEAAATDKASYIHEIPFTVYKGKDVTTSGYTVKLYRVDSATSRTEITTATAYEVQSLTTSKLTLDLRLITKATYQIVIVANGKEVADQQIDVSRVYQGYTINCTNGTAIHPLDTQRYDEAKVDANGNIVENPGRIYLITWYTNTAAKTDVKHNEGDMTVFSLDKTGIGSTSTDSWLEVYCTSEYKPAYSVAVSGTTVWTDSDGNPFIFN